MGITKGAEFEIKKISPFGDPVDIVIRGYELCLRRSSMEEIEVEVLE
jgi:Fe2+ transport system protein FeoA